MAGEGSWRLRWRTFFYASRGVQLRFVGGSVVDESIVGCRVWCDLGCRFFVCVSVELMHAFGSFPACRLASSRGMKGPIGTVGLTIVSVREAGEPWVILNESKFSGVHSAETQAGDETDRQTAVGGEGGVRSSSPHGLHSVELPW